MAVASGRLTRRAALALLLGACAPVRHGDLPDAQAAQAQGTGRLRLVIFEIANLDVPFHTGLIIETPAERAILDPAGAWESSLPQCVRQGEMIRNVTPEVVEDYLNRSGVSYAPGGWITHVFDFDTPAPVTQLALERGQALGPVAPLHCAFTVSTLLAGLPGFDWIEPRHVTAQLMEQVLLRPDVTYTRRDLSRGQTG